MNYEFWAKMFKWGGAAMSCFFLIGGAIHEAKSNGEEPKAKDVTKTVVNKQLEMMKKE